MVKYCRLKCLQIFHSIIYFWLIFFCRPMGQNNKIKMRKLNYTEKIEHNINDVNTSGVGKQQRWPKAK